MIKKDFELGGKIIYGFFASKSAFLECPSLSHVRSHHRTMVETAPHG